MNTFTTIALSALSGAAAAGAVVAVNFVELQSASPGAAQAGHINVTGNIISGRVGINTTPGLARLQINEAAGLQGVRSITGTGVAVYGQSTATTGLGAGGYFTSASAGGRALVAEQLSTSGATVGGLFYSRSTSGIAGYGKATATSGVSTGLLGESLSDDGYGVKAVNNSAGTGGTGLFASCNSASDGIAGVFAQNTLTTTGWGRAIHAQGGGTEGDAMFIECVQPGQTDSYAIKAGTDGSTGRGLYAYTTETTGVNYGVYGETASDTNGFGVFSSGNTGATGTKSMVIDNPMDPAHSVLKQYCAEGAEPFMVYSGTITLDSKGNGVATLPDYFGAIATKPRYSLTAVGAAMPNLHVATKVSGNQFTVAGGVSGGEVSWTIYATRNDPWVKANGAPTVVAKPVSEQGHYLTPELYGKKPSAKMGLQRAERMKRLQAEKVARP